MIAVIGCGNPNRSDDGVAAEVLRLLATASFPCHASQCHCEARSDEAIFFDGRTGGSSAGGLLRRFAPRNDKGGKGDVKLLDAGTDGMAVMFAARGCRSLIIVDACRSGSPPGAIFEVPGHELEHRPPPSMTLHDFRWDHALFAGRKMFGDDFPDDVTVLLIEAATVSLGTELSEPVAAAALKVAARIEAMVRTCTADTEGAAVAG